MSAVLTRTRARAAASVLATALTLAPSVAHGAEPTGVGSGLPDFSGGDWFGLVLRLGLVLVAVWGGVSAMRWYVRRTQGGGTGRAPARQLQLLETRVLGPNRSLQLVRLGDHAVLLGVTPERINALIAIDDAEEVARIVAEAELTRPRPLGAVLGGTLAARLPRAPRPDTVVAIIGRAFQRRRPDLAAARAAARAPIGDSRPDPRPAQRAPARVAPAAPSRTAAPAPAPSAAQRLQAAQGYTRTDRIAELQRAIAAARGQDQQ